MNQSAKQNQNDVQPRVLLLLSGGHDSKKAVEILLNSKHTIYALCIDGIQGKEKIGAEKVANQYNIPLRVVHINFFDEETWNPFKLIIRDLAMGLVAIREAKRNNCQYLATGVKLADIKNPSLGWLSYFLRFGEFVLKKINIQLIFPVWEDSKIKNCEVKNA